MKEICPHAGVQTQGVKLAGGGVAMDGRLPPLALAEFLHIVVGVFSYLCWLEKLLRPVRTRGERRKDRRREKRICGIILIILMLLGVCARREALLRPPAAAWDAGRLDRQGKSRSSRIRPICGGNCIQPHHLLYLLHLRSCASSAWGLVARDSCPLQPADWSSDMGIGSRIAVLVQGLYFMILWAWGFYMGDIMRLLVLGIGTIAWIRGFHFPFHICRKVSVIGGYWLSNGMGSDRILLLLAISCYPAFPNTHIFPALGQGGLVWTSTTPM